MRAISISSRGLHKAPWNPRNNANARAWSATHRLSVAILLAFAVLAFCSAALLPAFPVDETRYLTVAWEMRATGSWSLPTLNFEPYSHKPPLLFWLINASWSVFGIAVWPARLVGSIATLSVLWMTHALDRALQPDREPGVATSVLILTALPLFPLLGLSIMFDMLLTATVSGAMLALWTAGRSRSAAPFIAFGIAVGLGLLAKGPVVLVFTLPPALLARWWIDEQAREGWFVRFALAFGLACAIGLTWALRAAYVGGAEYAEMLLWKQSAGRIATSFAHARPFWFYAPVLLVFVAPLLIWRPAWVAMRDSTLPSSPQRNFLLAWIVPAFVGLSLISGKQIHYLLPVVPAVALLLSFGLREVQSRRSDRYGWLVLVAILGAFFIAAAVASGRGWLVDAGDSTLFNAASELELPAIMLTCVVAAGSIALFRGSVRLMLMGLAIANLMFLASLAYQMRASLGRSFDLSPVADAIAPLRDRPIAVGQRTRGEFGFLARLQRPVVYVSEADLGCWLARHADGIAIVRLPGDGLARLPAGTVLYQGPYRMTEVITVLAPSPQGGSAACAASP